MWVRKINVCLYDNTPSICSVGSLVYSVVHNIYHKE